MLRPAADDDDDDDAPASSLVELVFPALPLFPMCAKTVQAKLKASLSLSLSLLLFPHPSSSPFFTDKISSSNFFPLSLALSYSQCLSRIFQALFCSFMKRGACARGERGSLKNRTHPFSFASLCYINLLRHKHFLSLFLILSHTHKHTCESAATLLWGSLSI